MRTSTTYIPNMTRNENVPWRRIAVEAVAIVASILLAFAIDAWWEEQKDRELEQELLASLVEEFEGASAEFDIQWSGHEQRLAAATKLSTLNDKTIRQLNSEDLKRLWHQAYSPAISDPPQGALISAIATGRISLVRNKLLKSSLTGWSGRLANLHHTEQNISDYMENVFIPDMSGRAPLPYLSVVSTPDFGDALLAMAIKNHLNWIVLVTGIAQDENEQVQDEIAKILELLHNEIEH